MAYLSDAVRPGFINGPRSGERDGNFGGVGDILNGSETVKCRHLKSWAIEFLEFFLHKKREFSEFSEAIKKA